MAFGESFPWCVLLCGRLLVFANVSCGFTFVFVFLTTHTSLHFLLRRCPSMRCERSCSHLFSLSHGFAFAWFHAMAAAIDCCMCKWCMASR
jgi:hypothetical protein